MPTQLTWQVGVSLAPAHEEENENAVVVCAWHCRSRSEQGTDPHICTSDEDESVELLCLDLPQIFLLAGHLPLVPVHISTASHSEVAARHVNVTGRNWHLLQQSCLLLELYASEHAQNVMSWVNKLNWISKYSRMEVGRSPALGSSGQFASLCVAA